MTTFTEEFLTTKEVAAAFKVSPVTIARWEKSGALKAVRLGEHTLRFKREDVLAFIEGAK